MANEKLIAEFDSKLISKGTISERNEIGTPCLICGESVLVGWYDFQPKICEKCKAAVMKMRDQDGK